MLKHTTASDSFNILIQLYIFFLISFNNSDLQGRQIKFLSQSHDIHNI